MKPRPLHKGTGWRMKSFMIDLHCHMLPGIDDGPGHIGESLEMARVYAGAGFSTVVATPHCVPGSGPVPDPADILAGVEALNERIREAGIRLSVLPGMEVALDADVISMLGENRILPLAHTRCLLVEPPFQHLPPAWQQVLGEMKARGFEVLLAHPERCAGLMRQPGIVDELAAMGIFLQTNWSSLLGHHGTEAETLAWALLAGGHVHCLATDGHDARFRHAGHVAYAARAVADKVGSKNLELLTRENPGRLLRGEPLRTIDPGDRKRKRWWMW